MTTYSQRDSKWSKELMGDGTIGSYGCLITCISMLRDVDPKQTNLDIKSVGGYSGNFVVWDALDKISGLDFIKRVRVYENDEVAKNLPCLVEVNGAPIGGTTHWVLYIGNRKCWDPWDGTEKPTSAYKPIGYAVVKRLEVPSTPQTPVKIDLTGFKTDLEEYGVMEMETLKSKLLAKDTDIKSNQEKIDELEKSIVNANLEVSAIRRWFDDFKKVAIEKIFIRSICYGKGWSFQKVNKIKELVV